MVASHIFRDGACSDDPVLIATWFRKTKLVDVDQALNCLAEHRFIERADGQLYLLDEYDVRSVDEIAYWLRLRRRVIEEDGPICAYCHECADPPTVDHVTPRAKGGLSVRDNLVVACRRCNSAKGPRTPEQWRAANG